MTRHERRRTNARPERPAAVHGPNPNGGRDLVVGDVHGGFRTLEHALDTLSFDASADRLFSVGDLIDRGPDSARALEWLESGRITAAVRGNHEQMMADAFAAGETVWHRFSGAGRHWRDRGGGWWYESEAVESERARRNAGDARRPFALAERWAAALNRLPYIMTIEGANACIGVVHASGFANDAERWTTIETRARRLSSRDVDVETEAFQRNEAYRLLWRDGEQLAEHRDDPALPEPLPGIDLVVTGHSPGLHPRWARGNVVCIDTGLHWADWGHLTVAEVQGPQLVLHRFAHKEGAGPG